MENSGQLNTPKIETLLEECIRRNASDLHIQYGLPPILRIDGALTPIADIPALPEEAVRSLIFSTLDDDQQKILIKDKEFDFSFAFGDIARFRVNAFHERGKLAAAFRLIPNQIKNINDLGMPAIVETFADFPRGLVLVTGPTGSGKSTTLAALVDKINREKSTNKHTYYNCRCLCGNTSIIVKRSDNLNENSNCGCIKRKVSINSIKALY